MKQWYLNTQRYLCTVERFSILYTSSLSHCIFTSANNCKAIASWESSPFFLCTEQVCMPFSEKSMGRNIMIGNLQNLNELLVHIKGITRLHTLPVQGASVKLIILLMNRDDSFSRHRPPSASLSFLQQMKTQKPLKKSSVLSGAFQDFKLHSAEAVN